MKQKVGTLLEKDVLRRASDEGRFLSGVIQDALEKYLSAGLPEPARREAAIQLFCKQPIRLSPGQFKALLEHDSRDQ